MIDQELLKACVINPWAVTPRMMLIDSMIENGWEEFKAMEAFEPTTLSQHLPSIYGVGNGDGIGIGNGDGSGSGICIGCGSSNNNGYGSGIIICRGSSSCYGNSNGYRLEQQ